jgi:hypothetical protein
MQWLFAVTLFLSAALLFWVELMIPKAMLLPLGGSPAVWNTCMVFFQAGFLAGYVYPHLLARSLNLRFQIIAHLILLGVPFLFLPLVVATEDMLQIAGPPYESDPVVWLLRVLVLTLGMPFFVVCTTSVLLQKWFSLTSHPAASDPYFLFSFSNLGSMIGLFGYLLVLEPILTVGTQAKLWAIGYGVLAALIVLCAVAAWRGRQILEQSEVLESASVTPDQGYPASEQAIQSATLVSAVSPSFGGEKLIGQKPAHDAIENVMVVTLGRRLRWLALAFVPTALYLAVTTYITTDVAAVPLLWGMPLAVYLLTFILVFARKQLVPAQWMQEALPFITLGVVFTFITNVGMQHWLFIPLHWMVLFVAAMACHGQLAADRPPTRYLTEFYLWLAVGGVLGGLFAALAAPVLFQSGILEYPLLLVLACWLRPGKGLWDSPSVARWLDLLAPLGIAVLTLALMWAVKTFHPQPTMTLIAMVLGIVSFFCFLMAERPTRFALSVGAMFMCASVAYVGGLHTQYTERNFFGIVRVQEEAPWTKAVQQDPERPPAKFRWLMHGSTMHGLQQVDDQGRPDPLSEPLSYFTRSGPIGQIFDVFTARSRPDAPEPRLPPRVAVAGLGVGALASYAQPDQEWTFYEIDPAIQRVAENPKFFGFLDKCKASKQQIVLGDARLRLKEAEQPYGLIVLDAFSSDAVPVHLLTQEALALYQNKLAPGGLIAFNITNRYLNLKPVLANMARAAQPPLVCYAWLDKVSKKEEEEGKRTSHWLVMAQRAEDLGPIAKDKERWVRLEGRPDAPLWTDDFSNILSVFRWADTQGEGK